MIDKNLNYESEGETVQGFTSKNRMPKTPDFSSKMIELETAKNPFLLDDFKGVWAHRISKP